MYAVASTVIFPGLQISSNPKEPLSGFGSWLFNDYIRSSKINVSFVTTDSVGSGCHLSNGSKVLCDGVYEQLQTCEADFSLFPLDYTEYDYNLPNAPILNGPLIGSTGQVMATFNRTAGTKSSLYVGLPRINKFIVLAITFLILILVIVNCLYVKYAEMKKSICQNLTWRPLKMRPRKRPQGRYHFDLKRVLGIFDLRSTRVTWFLFLIFFMLTFSLIIGILETNQIVTEPPKFFKTIIEAARAESYKLLVVEGVITVAEFKKSREPILRQIASEESKHRLKWFKPLEITSLADYLMKNPATSFHASPDQLASTVKAYICNMWISTEDEKIRKKFTPPWFLKIISYAEKLALATYSSCIKPEVRNRLDKIFQRIINSALWTFWSADSAFRVPVLNERKNMLCIKNAPPFEASENFAEKGQQETNILKVLIVIFALPMTGLILSLFILTFEKIQGSRERRKSIFIGYARTKMRRNQQIVLMAARYKVGQKRKIARRYFSRVLMDTNLATLNLGPFK